MTLKLKVKICTLAAESKIIRTQQRNLEKRAGKFPLKPVDGTDREIALAMRLERKRHKAKLAIIKMGQKPANIWPELQQHRRNDVRRASRAALLAYAFLRGRDYFSLEAKYHDGNSPDWKEIEKNINRFTLEKDPRIVAQQFEEWKQRGLQDQKQHRNQQKASQAA